MSWCPEGYVTLSEAYTAAVQVARGLIYPQYGDPTDIYALFDGSLPREVPDMAWALGSWLLQDLMRQEGWGVSTREGVFVRLNIERLLSVGDFHGYPANLFQPYNPITTIGPPSPEWLSYFGRGYSDRFTLVDFRKGVVRGVLPWTFWKSALLRKMFRLFPMRIGPHHVARALSWGMPMTLGWKFRGRAVCLKASDLRRWESQTNEYLAMFLERPVGPPASAVPVEEPQRTKGRKPTTRKEVAAAILDLYGNVHEPVGVVAQLTHEA